MQTKSLNVGLWILDWACWNLGVLRRIIQRRAPLQGSSKCFDLMKFSAGDCRTALFENTSNHEGHEGCEKRMSSTDPAGKGPEKKKKRSFSWECPICLKPPKWPDKGRFGEGFCRDNITPPCGIWRVCLFILEGKNDACFRKASQMPTKKKQKKMPRTRCGMLFSQHVVLHIWPNTTQHRDGELQRRKSLHMKRLGGIGIIPCEPLPFPEIVNHACSRKIRILIPILIADHANPNFIQKLVFWTLKSCWVFFSATVDHSLGKKTMS